jgi:hypothetical protein
VRAILKGRAGGAVFLRADAAGISGESRGEGRYFFVLLSSCSLTFWLTL